MSQAFRNDAAHLRRTCDRLESVEYDVTPLSVLPSCSQKSPQLVFFLHIYRNNLSQLSALTGGANDTNKFRFMDARDG